jgi:hypothetical protein
LVRLSQPKGPPFFLSPRPSPSPPEDLVPPGPREPVTIPTDLIDALEGLGYTTLGQAHLASLGTLKDCGLGIYSAGTWVSQCS